MLAQINWFYCCNFQDCQSDYLNLLSLLDSGFNGLNSDNMVIDSSTDISLLKERVAQYIASECKSGSPRFVEYWVPVQLSNVQLEQYCASLLSNSMFLSSCLKSEPADVLRDIIISARKVTPNQTTAHDFFCFTMIFTPFKCRVMHYNYFNCYIYHGSPVICLFLVFICSAVTIPILWISLSQI